MRLSHMQLFFGFDRDVLLPLKDAHTALWWAAYCGHVEALGSLVAAGANPATKDLVRVSRHIT